MTLSIDTTLLTNVCTWIGQAHNAYIRVVGNEADQNGPFFWLEAVKSYVRGGNDLTSGLVATQIAAPASGPTIVVNTSGAVTFKYVITFVAGGETTAGSEVTQASCATTPNNTLNSIPTGGPSVTARGVYRTVGGGGTGTEHLVAYITDNTTTTYTDTTADGSLGAAVPTSNTTGGVTVAAQGSPNNTVNVTGGSILNDNVLVSVGTNATYGSSTIFTQTCTDGSALTLGQFYDCALCADHKGVLAVFRGPREDRPDTENKPVIPQGYVLLAMIRINYQAGGTSVINTADITQGQVLTSYSAQTNDPAARIFADFDAGQTNLISRKAVKNELGFASTSLDNYVKTITASQGLGTNGQGLTFLAWAKSTHQTASPWDFPLGFVEYIRYLKNGKDPSQRLGTIAFTGSGTATVTDLKKVLGLQDQLELIVTSVGGTSSATSTITVTTQSTGAASAITWQATIPSNSPNGTVITLVSTGTAPLQTPVKGTATKTAIASSNVLSAQPAGTYPPSTRIYTALVPTSPVTVAGGTNGDTLAIRNVGTL